MKDVYPNKEVPTTPVMMAMVLYLPANSNPPESPVRNDPEVKPRKRAALVESSPESEVKIAGISSVESLSGALVGSSPDSGVVIEGISSVESSSAASIFLSEEFSIVLVRVSVKITLMWIKVIEI